MMKDSHGFAAVHYAAKFNRPEIMRMLVEEGCAGAIISYSGIQRTCMNP